VGSSNVGPSSTLSPTQRPHGCRQSAAGGGGRAAAVEEAAGGLTCSTSPAVRLALDGAAEQGDLQAVAALLAGGADPNAADSFGFTALHAAAAARHGNSTTAALIQALVAAGGNPNARLANGATPLHQAARTGCLAALQALLAAGADVSSRDSLGRTPLHLAAGKNAECVEALLRAGAPVAAVDNSRRQPLDMAHEAQLLAVEQLLWAAVGARRGEPWGACNTAAAGLPMCG
jgi:ankyrin repeat protein